MQKKKAEYPCLSDTQKAEGTKRTNTKRINTKKINTAIQKISVLITRAAEILYPPRCILCDEILRDAQEGCCVKCRPHLPYIKGARCQKCGKPVEEEAEYCEDCGRYRHVFDCGIAVFTYTGQIRQSVYRMKAANRRDYLAFYTQEMAGLLKPYLKRWMPEVIIPVPMHPKKKRARGYNQAELLARGISALCGIPVDADTLYCTKKTRSQKHLDLRGRMKNLRGAFALKEDVYGAERVLIVDDIYTTGSTVDEAARVLMAAGVRHVFFIVLCTGKGKRQ